MGSRSKVAQLRFVIFARGCHTKKIKDQSAPGRASQQTFIGKTKILAVADNQVVEQLDIEYFGGITNLLGELYVGLTGFEIA